MDIKQHYSDPEEMLRTAILAALTQVWTAIPGEIVSYDSQKVTVVVQPAIKAQITDKSGKQSMVSLPVLPDVPVLFPGGGGCRLTFPIQAGDECLVVFASRSIDAWWQSGGVQPPIEPRMHDLSDGFAIVGPMSQAKKISNISATTTQLRSNDGSTYVELDPNGQILNFVAPGGVSFNTPTAHFTGNVTSDKTITGTTDVVGGGKSLKSHIHSGVSTGTSNSGPPV